jgi:hypothetical protein
VASAAERDEILRLVAVDPPPSGVSVAVAELPVAADLPRADADNVVVPMQLRAIYSRDGLAAGLAAGNFLLAGLLIVHVIVLAVRGRRHSISHTAP